jgi:signal transduction histidine kinase
MPKASFGGCSLTSPCGGPHRDGLMTRAPHERLKSPTASSSTSPTSSREAKDYSELEKQVEALAETNERLQERARLRQEFLRNVSHELATPMTPVVGYLKLLLNGELGPLTPLQKKSLLAIQQSTERLRALIDTLLDVTGLETDRMHFYERSFDFGEVVQRVIHDERSRFEDNGITLTTHLVRDPMPCMGDPDKLSRAMWHVLDNAIKFTPPGGEVVVRVRHDRAPGQQTYALIVTDTGPGIDPSEIEKVTEPFYQVDGSATRSFGGVGLGLAFVRRVVDVLGGSLRIVSPPPPSDAVTESGVRAPTRGPAEGTEVTLVIPAERPLASGSVAHSGRAAGSEP